MRLALTGFLSIPGLAFPASHASLEICLAANMLWKALISYLGRSSMHQDNKPYLISLCSLMSQLKGLVLPLAMGLAGWIVCRLVNVGLWRSWSTFKNACLVPQSFLYAHIGVLACLTFLCQVAGVPYNGWKASLHTVRSKVLLITSDKPVVQAKTKMCMIATQG